jgi:hypothetical protein
VALVVPLLSRIVFGSLLGRHVNEPESIPKSVEKWFTAAAARLARLELCPSHIRTVATPFLTTGGVSTIVFFGFEGFSSRPRMPPPLQLFLRQFRHCSPPAHDVPDMCRVPHAHSICGHTRHPRLDCRQLRLSASQHAQKLSPTPPLDRSLSGFAVLR